MKTASLSLPLIVLSILLIFSGILSANELSSIKSDLLPWFNSCDDDSELTWALNNAARFSNGSLETLPSKHWCTQKLHFKGELLEMSWMVKLEGQGSFNVSFGESEQGFVWSFSNEVNELDQMVWSSKVAPFGKLALETAERQVEFKNEDWHRLKFIKRDQDLEIYIDGQLIDYLGWAPDTMFPKFNSSLEMMATCDEFFIGEAEAFSSSVKASMMQRKKSLPMGWIQDQGVWSVVEFPRTNTGVLVQNKPGEGVLRLGKRLNPGTSFEAEVRFDGLGSAGLGLFDDEGNGVELTLRERVQYGLQCRGRGKERTKSFFRKAIDIYPGIWYHLRIRRELGFDVVDIDGEEVGRFSSFNAFYPVLISDCTGVALFKNIEIKGIASSQEQNWLAVQPLEGGVLRESDWVNSKQYSMIPSEDENFAKGVFSLRRGRVDFQWNWDLKRSQGGAIALTKDEEHVSIICYSFDGVWNVIWTSNVLNAPNVAVPEEELAFLRELGCPIDDVVFKKQIDGDGRFDLSLSSKTINNEEKTFSLSINGRAAGRFSLQGFDNGLVELMSFGSSKIFNEYFGMMNRSFSQTKNASDLSMIQGELSSSGGGLNSESLGDSRSLTLAYPLVRSSELRFNISPEKHGLLELRVASSEGQALTKLPLRITDFRELISHVGSEDEGVFALGNQDGWVLTCERSEGTLSFFIGSQEVMSMELSTQDPCWLSFDSIEGDFEAFEPEYRWSAGSALSLLDPSREKSESQFWSSASTLDREKGFGEFQFSEPLPANHSIWLQSVALDSFKSGGHYLLNLQHEDYSIAIRVVFLGGACVVEWLEDWKVVHQEKLDAEAFQMLIQSLNGEMKLWLNGKRFPYQMKVKEGLWNVTFKPSDDADEQGPLYKHILWSK